jgi:MFS family permease
VFATPALIELAFAGFTYAAMQICLSSFLVVYLTETLRLSLIAAGLALTVANVGGIVGRIGWGAIADRFVRPRTLLGAIGVASGVCAYGTAAFDARWPAAAVLAVCALFGATAIGWNGVQLAEIARRAPAGQAGTTTGATGFITFAGVVIGPPTFALLAAVTGSYRVGFAVFGTLSILYGLRLLAKAQQ